MWNLMLKKEFGDIIIQSFKTKKEAEDEVKNRGGLLYFLKASIKNSYYTKKCRK
jgi:hypothetical protein|tara:strand:- start:197 stop:358 length:162 start_codon:yes stop_codon:yes gene_type:complete